VDIQVYIQSGIIESYVLGVANAEETEELLRLAVEYPAVKQAIRTAEEAFEQNALNNSIAPDASIKENLLATLQHDFLSLSSPATPVRNMPAATVSRVSILWKAVAAASIILLVVSAAFNFYLYSTYKDSHTRYMALLSEKNTMQASMEVYKAKLLETNESIGLMSNPAMAQVKMPGVPGKETNLATIYWNTQTKDVYLLQNKLPVAPAGKQYQLWAIVDGKPVDAGVLDNCTGLCKMKNIPAAQAFAVTLEKRGGSPAPTLSDLFVMGKV
jgi:anti-sigma-K factor RskA